MKSLKRVKPSRETATMGGGCFWCMEALLGELHGIEKVTSGYAGGTEEPPRYEDVCTGTTGYAEVVQVVFDPAVISYADLLRIFFSVHNPTSINHPGSGKGTQYRSVIFYHSEQQQQTANEVIAELGPYFEKKILTEIAPLTTFYQAEERHQQYYKKDPSKAYCQSVIHPKLHKLRAHFRQYTKPVVVQE